MNCFFIKFQHSKTKYLRRFPITVSLTEDKLIYKWKKDVGVTIFDDEMAQFEFNKVELLSYHTKLASRKYSVYFNINSS